MINSTRKKGKKGGYRKSNKDQSNSDDEKDILFDIPPETQELVQRLEKMIADSAAEKIKKETEAAAVAKPKNKHLPEQFSEGFIRRMTEPLFCMPATPEAELEYQKAYQKQKEMLMRLYPGKSE